MRLRLSHKHIPLLSTLGVFLLLYVVASIHFREQGFLSLRVFVNLFVNNSFLGIIAVGMTFVIISGGIDLSVGSVMALSAVTASLLMSRCGVPPVLAVLVVLAAGAAMGFVTGCVIRFFALAPFIVTLAGLFFARGLALVLCPGSVSIDNRFYRAVTTWEMPLSQRVGVPLVAFIFVAVVLAGIAASVWTRFGRNVYAVGGNEEAALLMGVPVGRTKVLVYTLSGFCSALGGVVFTFYSSGANPRAGVGLELDAIAAVVVGGTLLTGGVGYVFGTLVGVLIFGVIQTAITFQTGVNEFWTRIAIGSLLLVFILLQKLFARPALRGRSG